MYLRTGRLNWNVRHADAFRRTTEIGSVRALLQVEGSHIVNSTESQFDGISAASE
jgi:hypothetical protein